MKFNVLSDEELISNENPWLLDAGVYKFSVYDAKETKSKESDMIALTLEIYGPNNVKSRIYDYLVSTLHGDFPSKTKNFLDYRVKQFIDSIRCSDKYTIGELTSADCIDKTGMVEIDVEEYEGKLKNKVKRYVVADKANKDGKETKIDPNFNDDIPF